MKLLKELKNNKIGLKKILKDKKFNNYIIIEKIIKDFKIKMNWTQIKKINKEKIINKYYKDNLYKLQD